MLYGTPQFPEMEGRQYSILLQGPENQKQAVSLAPDRIPRPGIKEAFGRPAELSMVPVFLQTTEDSVFSLKSQYFICVNFLFSTLSLSFFKRCANFPFSSSSSFFFFNVLG